MITGRQLTAYILKTHGVVDRPLFVSNEAGEVFEVTGFTDDMLADETKVIRIDTAPYAEFRSEDSESESENDGNDEATE